MAEYTYIARTAFAWGSGPTIAEALSNIPSSYGYDELQVDKLPTSVEPKITDMGTLVWNDGDVKPERCTPTKDELLDIIWGHAVQALEQAQSAAYRALLIETEPDDKDDVEREDLMVHLDVATTKALERWQGY